MDDYLDKSLESLIPTLYQFSHSLIPDELQAKQLVIDSASRLLAREGETFYNKPQSILKLSLFKAVFELSSKRVKQIPAESFSDTSPYKTFYDLCMQERAILFLSRKLFFSTEEIMYVLKLNRFETIELLHHSLRKVSRAGFESRSSA